MIAHDTLAIYVSRGDELEPIEIVGENSHLFGREAFPIAKGPVGPGDPAWHFDPERGSMHGVWL